MGHRGDEPLVLTPTADKLWRPLIEGHLATANRALATIPADAPDLLASAARGGWAFAQANESTSLTAAEHTLSLARRETSPLRGLDAVAMSWLATWLDEGLSTSEGRASLEAKMTALSIADLSWEARFLRADALMHSARRRLDPRALAQQAAELGCITTFLRGPALGSLPHLDLDAADGSANGVRDASALPPLPLPHSGCDVDVFSADGHPAAERLWAHVRVAEGGTWRLVLDAPAESRVRVDGHEVARHNGPERVPSRFATTTLHLDAGTHDIEVRLANVAGRTRMAFALMAETRSALDELETLTQKPGPNSAVALWATALLAHRLGEPVRAQAAAERLEALPSFFLGQVVVADVRRADPTRPPAFGRDAARQNLRRAWESDHSLQRVAETAAALEMEDEHPREALALLNEAHQANETSSRGIRGPGPGWWAIGLARAQDLRARGLVEDADRALDEAVVQGGGSCAVWESALRRAEERRERHREDQILGRLTAMCPGSSARLLRLADQGRLTERAALLTRILEVTPSREDAASDLAEAWLALGQARRATDVLRQLTVRSPLEASYRLRLVDAWAAAGDKEQGRRVLLAALDEHPESAELLRAARTFGVELPLDKFRLDGKALIRAHQTAGRVWDAPAVMVLDRAVTRIFPNGAQMTLTHNIVKVETKDGIDKWGEVAVPEGAEILTLRTRKADGSVHEAESIAGKDSISVPDLAPGDFVEWETLETDAPSAAFHHGFVGDRFYFRSYDAPLERSEALIVAAPERLQSLTIDRRAGAPAPVREAAPPGVTGVEVVAMRATQVPQLFAERSAVPAIEFVPSARVSSGVTWKDWCRFVKEELYGNARATPLVQQVAHDIERDLRSRPTSSAAEGHHPPAAPSSRALAEALVAWTNQNVEATDELQDVASEAIARGRGSRLAVVQALAAALGLKTDVVLVRSRLVASAEAPTPVAEIDDFAEPLLRFRGLEPRDAARHDAADVFVDLRLKHAPLGYLPPALDGARFLALEGATFGVTSGHGDDHRQIDLSLKLESQGGGRALAQETLRGWPALEWAELVDRFGGDRARMRQDFEQRWLGAQFPGAVLEDLDVEVLGPGDAPISAPTGKASLAYAASGVRLKYSFASPQLGTRRAQELTLLPTFFRSQPGRRFATEARRATALQLGFDVPLDLRATVELPASARIIDPETQGSEHVGQGAGYRFGESREVVASATRPTILLQRDARVPLMRVSPDAYPTVAADLRRVDAFEQRPLRIRLPAVDRERIRSDAQP